MKVFIYLLMSTFFILVGYLLYNYALLKPQQKKIYFLPESDCNLQLGPCQFTDPQIGTMQITITPQPILANQKLNIKVTYEKDLIKDMKIDFYGINMNMGYNRPTLQKTGDHFSGMGALPICTVKKMLWSITVLYTVEQKTYGKKFSLETKNP